MTPEFMLRQIIRPTMRWLPPNMRSREAEAMLVAIALQESGLRHRKQIRGPARGFWQFEVNGAHGVLTHRNTREHARRACDTLLVETSGTGVTAAVEHNDILACIFARLLLWTVPSALPTRGDSNEGWDQYLWAWRPGKPHKERWLDNWERAWEAVDNA